jgi:hypothetical protein
VPTYQSHLILLGEPLPFQTIILQLGRLYRDKMPQRSVSHQVQSVWDRLTRRRDFWRPRRYADVAAAQRRSQTLDSRPHLDESLVSFGQVLRDGGRLSAHSTAGTAHIPLDASGFSDQHLVDYSINRSTIYCDPPEETVKIPVVRCATSLPNAPDEGQEVDHPVWYLPGDVSLQACAQPQSPLVYS